MKQRIKGFTIVELLIVIVVIGILAAVTIVAYNGVKEKANMARIKSDLTGLEKAIHVARINTDQTLYQILQNGNHTGGACTTSLPGGTDVSTLAKSSSCWTTYLAALTKIETASRTSLNGLRDGDPYGQPYYIDQNEGESVAQKCTKDIIGTILRPLPGSMPGGAYTWLENRRDVALMTPGC